MKPLLKYISLILFLACSAPNDRYSKEANISLEESINYQNHPYNNLVHNKLQELYDLGFLKNKNNLDSAITKTIDNQIKNLYHSPKKLRNLGDSVTIDRIVIEGGISVFEQDSIPIKIRYLYTLHKKNGSRHKKEVISAVFETKEIELQGEVLTHKKIYFQ